MNLKDTYNRIARDWHDDHKDDRSWVPGTEKFLSYLRPHAHILDVGCGGGIKSKYFIEKGFRVSGIDLSEKLIEIARREIPSAELLVMDMRDTSAMNERFDGIFAHASLLHIPKREVAQVFQNFMELLGDDGYLYVGVKEQKPEQPEEELKKEDDYGYEYERFFSYFQLDELRKFFEGIGFEVVYAGSSYIPFKGIEVIGKKRIK